MSIEQLRNVNVENEYHIDDIDDHIDQFLDQDDDELSNEEIIIE